MAPVLLAALAACPAGALTLEEVLETMRAQERRLDAEVHDMVYLAEATLVEWQDFPGGRQRRRTESVRRVTVVRPDTMRNEYLSMSIDGRPLSQAEMRRETGRDRGRSAALKSPFREDMAGLYLFRLSGSELLEGVPVWVVEFEPRQAGEGLGRGRAYVDAAGRHAVALEFTPSRLPGVVKHLQMTLRLAPVEGYWLPSRFTMEARVKVQFLFTLAERTFSFEDRYSHYRLNTACGQAPAREGPP